MSGIFGVLDPSGPDVEAVTTAVRRGPPRGNPEVWSSGPMVLGHYRTPQGWSQLVETDCAVFAADARVDATLTSRAAALGEHHQGAPLLAAVIDEMGPDGLDDLAADFAIARFDKADQRLLLARDAFGARPLFWARRGRRVGFAADADLLVDLGLADGTLDPDMIAVYLSGWDFSEQRTAFEGVRRVPGGGWIEVADGRLRAASWFRPGDVVEAAWSEPDAVEALQDAVTAAVVSRTRERRSALLLSGGRDSGSIAVAAARAGVELSCLTNRYPPGTGCSEENEALELARAVGLPCTTVPMPAEPTENDLARLPQLSGTPMAMPSFAETAAAHDAITAMGCEVVLDGENGDALFRAGPVAVLDLLRARDYAGAARTGRARARPSYGYGYLLKTLARSLVPRTVVAARERMRSAPPWVRGARGATHAMPPRPRTLRGELIGSMTALSLSPAAELCDRSLVGTGVMRSSPFVDQRVVRLVLSLPQAMRIPTATDPKPLLRRAFLDSLDQTRRKTSFFPYYVAVAQGCRRRFAHWVGPGMLASQAGFVDWRQLAEHGDGRWQIYTLRCFAVEAWLRRGTIEATGRIG